jgi:anti-sigma regulatory factor (Ser/Thr protein kinase)
VTARPPNESELKLTLAADARYAAVVRRALETLLADAAADAEVIADVKTTVTEACTNVVRHAYRGEEAGQLEVEAQLDPGSLAVSVRDWGRGIHPPGNGAGPEIGLGLFLIHSLADELEVRTAPTGTEVLMQFDLRRFEPRPEDTVDPAPPLAVVPA